jgi:hypothetical protein
MAENFQQMLKCDINSARNRPLDSYSTEWYTNLSKFPKLRTYRTFKSSFSREYTPLTIHVPDTHKSYCQKMDMYHYKIDTTIC